MNNNKKKVFFGVMSSLALWPLLPEIREPFRRASENMSGETPRRIRAVWSFARESSLLYCRRFLSSLRDEQLFPFLLVRPDVLCFVGHKERLVEEDG